MGMNYIEMQPQLRTEDFPINLVFFNKEGEVGRLTFNEKTKMWQFTGDKEDSAVEFTAWLNVTFKQQLEKLYGSE